MNPFFRVSEVIDVPQAGAHGNIYGVCFAKTFHVTVGGKNIRWAALLQDLDSFYLLILGMVPRVWFLVDECPSHEPFSESEIRNEQCANHQWFAF